MSEVIVTAATEAAPVNVVPSLAPSLESAPAQVVEKDLVTKISEFKRAKISTTAENNNSFFDYKEIDKIQDPVAKKFAEDAYKSMQSGFTKKTQEIAEQRRAFEQKLQESQSWSKERLQRELNNPQFLQAAQEISSQNPVESGLTDEQFSSLTPVERSEISQLKNKITSLEQGNFQSLVAQRDTQLQSRYADYNPSQIDSTLRDLAQMSPLDIREHVYKSLKHDEDVAAAYELGKSEARGLNQQKINAITSNGNEISNSDDRPIREKNETSQSYLMKIALANLAKFKNRK